MSENNQMMSLEGQLVGMPLAGPESFSQQQLDYLKRALGVDETVLFNNGSTSVSECTLSEAASNFEYLDFVVGFPGESNGLKVERVPGNASVFHFTYGAGQGATDYFIRVYGTISGTAVATSKSKTSYGTYTSSSAETIRNNNSSDLQCIYKVVGIHRIAGGN